MLTWEHFFGSFGAKSLDSLQEFGESNKNGNPNFGREAKKELNKILKII